MDWERHITVDPAICHGQPVVRGTRVLVSLVLDELAGGATPEAIARGYDVTQEDVLAVLQYAAELAREQYVALPLNVA